MTDQFSSILPILRQFGLSPENLSYDQIERLKQLAETNEITPEITREIMNMFGIRAKEKTTPKYIDVKIGRNELCPCESGKKYKKCCYNS